jgi:hypothetical protein
MAFKDVKAGVRNTGNLIKQAMDLTKNQSFAALSGVESFNDAQQQFGTIFGGEGFNTFQKGMTDNLSHGGFDAAKAAIGRNNINEIAASVFTTDVLSDIAKRQGLESFTLAQFPGQSMETKAVNIVLNTQTRLQTKAAEELYKTISVRYEDEGVKLTVRAAGVGSYVSGASAWESMTELTPIFGILRNGDIFKDDVLRVWPVLPADADDENAQLFIDASIKAPVDQEYPTGDAYGRQDHLTQMLAVPGVVNNLLGLCTAPGQRPWTDTDDIESASIRILELGFAGKLNGKDIQAFVPTESMTNINMSPTSVGQNSNDRDLDITLRHLPVTALVDKDGKSVKALFQAFYDKGLEPNLNVRMTARYNRQSYRLELTTGKVTIESLTDLNDNNKRITHSSATEDQKALLNALKGGLVNAATPSMNLTNASNGNFGYRLEVFDTSKELTTRRQDPISVKYPVRPEDVNKEALDDAVSYMGVTIQTNCSKKAFETAYKHLDYLTSIDGAPVVDNENGGNDLPGRMYVKASTVHRSFRIQDHISSPENIDVFDNVCSLLLTEIQDITAALAFKSGIAAINEYSGIAKTKWSVIVHQNLERFLMRSGDARITASEDFNIVATNFDSMIGKILIVPQNDSTEDRINPLGGIGVNVAKENVVLHGQVTRGNQDFGVMMTMPCYLHWNLNVIVGSLVIEDAADFLGDAGVFFKLGGVKVSSAPGTAVNTNSNGAATGPSEVKIVNDATSPVVTQAVPASGN